MGRLNYPQAAQAAAKLDGDVVSRLVALIGCRQDPSAGPGKNAREGNPGQQVNCVTGTSNLALGVAKPTTAWVDAGASLTLSHTMSTPLPCACNSLTVPAFCPPSRWRA